MENLEHLIGSKVRIFRGGPESRDGVLLDTQSDYLALYTKADGVVYYNLSHIKSVIKNAKDGQNPHKTDEELCMKAYSFQDLLRNLKGSHIQIDRGGPESRDGKLLDVFSDFLVLETKKEGVIYYKTHHIKSVSVIESKERNAEEHDDNSQYEEAMNFQDLLQKLKYSWVKINRGGPEKIEGVLVDSSEDYLVLTVNDEVNRIPIFHIRNVSVVENELKMDMMQQKDEAAETDENAQTDEEEKQVNNSDVRADDEGQDSSDETNDNDNEEKSEEWSSENDGNEEQNVEGDNEKEKYYNYNPPGPVWFNDNIRLN